MKTTNWLFFLTLTLFLFGCKKASIKQNTSPDSFQNDSTVLKSYTEINVFNGKNDTIKKISFEYDNSQRLSKEVEINYINNIPDYTRNYKKTFYYYTGADTLINKRLDIYIRDPGYNDSSIYFFVRNSGNIIISDSMVRYYYTPGLLDTLKRTLKFTIYQDSIIENYQFYPHYLTQTISGKQKIVQLKSNNEIIKETVYDYTVSIGYKLYEEIYYLFDNSYNPLYRKNINYPFILHDNLSSPFLIGGPNYWYSSKFNAKEITHHLYSTVLSTWGFSYSLNHFNFPNTVVHHYTAPAPAPFDEVKGIYEYLK